MHFDLISRFWFVTTHAECAAALSDGRFSASLGQRERVRDDDLPASMLTSDAPDHARLRGPGALLLGPAALRPQTRAITDAASRVAGGLAGRGEADAAADIGEPFAAAVFASLFTLADEDGPEFTSLARRVSVNLDPLAGPAAGAAGRAATGEFADFMDRHIGALQEAGVVCPLTRLAGDGRLTRTEMLGIVSLAVIGGYLPLADLAGHAAYWLTAAGLTFGSLGAELADAGAGRVVDELMRLATPIPFTARVTREPVELGGVRLAAGARVLLVVAAANRDPLVFDRPGEFDPGRSPNPQLAFGAGPHLCLGAPLVRWAGGVLLAELAGRFPLMRQAGPAEWDKPLVPRRLRDQRLLLG